MRGGAEASPHNINRGGNMTGIVIVTHGKLGEGLLDAIYLIAGPQKQIEEVALLEEDSVELLKDKILTAIRKVDSGSGTIVFVDMFGASPSNAAAYLINENIEVVTGVNLPMILEIINLRDSMSLIELTNTAMNAGKESIKNLSEIVRSTLKK
jgi:PTS system mannose-specific IIA component